MIKFIYLTIIGLIFSTFSIAQQAEEIAFSINDKPVYKSELEREYKKHQTEDTISVSSFLTSYIDYKLNLEEAYTRQLDTTGEFRKELETYRIELNNRYLQDTVAENELVGDILSRFEHELEVNHVFVPFDSLLVFPKDTMSYYQQALEMRQIAQESRFDEEKMPKMINSFGVVLNYEIQSGYLGWIRPFFFSQQLEKILYNLELNKITMPIRTETGYHVFEVTDRRPLQGNPVVEQLLFGFPQIPPSQHVQDSVYRVAVATFDEIGIKDNFQPICDEFSRVFETGDRGCLLGELAPGAQAPLPLIEAAYRLEKLGDITKPVLTAYGYHILRLKERKNIPSKERIRESIKESLNDKKVLLTLLDHKRKRMEKRTKTEVNRMALSQLFELTNEYTPRDSLFDEKVENKDEILISIDNGAKKYSIGDFLQYKAVISGIENPENEDPLAMVKVEPIVLYNLSTDILQNYFNSFLYMVLSRYEKAVLETKNPEFSRTIQDISNGIMYSMLQEKEIWRKSKTDTEGLQKTFLANKDKYQINDDAFKGMVVLSKKENVLSEIEKKYKENKDVSPAELRKIYNSQGLTIMPERGTWRKGDNPFVDFRIYDSEKKPSTKAFPYFAVFGQLISSPEDYADVRTEVEADYQKALEAEWRDYLHHKYTVEINDAVIKKIK